MKNSKLFSRISYVFTFLLLASISAACSNSTSGEEEEQEPIGFVIYEGDNELVSQNIRGEVTGSITVESTSSAGLRIAFIDEAAEVFTPEKDEHSLQFQTTDGDGSISIAQDNASEPFLFTVTGESAGSATFTFQLLHVGSPEFESAAISVTVTSSN
tara:strand:- start:49 stop:519 length:471 start_codon:yes stop_codon:yes gene_type:complete